MRRLQMLLAFLAVMHGAFWMLLTFAFSTLVDPELQGRSWWRAVFETMFGEGMGTIGVGLISLIFGVWLMLPTRRNTTPEP